MEGNERLLFWRHKEPGYQQVSVLVQVAPIIPGSAPEYLSQDQVDRKNVELKCPVIATYKFLSNIVTLINRSFKSEFGIFELEFNLIHQPHRSPRQPNSAKPV